MVYMLKWISSFCLLFMNIAVKFSAQQSDPTAVFTAEEYQMAGFDFSQLHLVREYSTVSPECESQQVQVKVYSYPILEEGEIINTNISIATPLNIKNTRQISSMTGEYIGLFNHIIRKI
ncbi:uncharacterized protein LOC111716048 [Eurytemora carolleeae]|uniref:uncharacterized protein LOC111716048 n=1 Tax=Eurytemora carolleeae TaxID=1294199 RepID=UPI000C759731|nr:uncharacterized protein LOC111716048 [Eurytemora carolleeae]|eukprot:XP_023347229.1 uncharacterized protein LOC111716048 [Eurytemora affinis]